MVFVCKKIAVQVMKLSIVSLCALLIILGSCTTSNEPDKLTKIYGVFVDESGNPIADADVCVIPDLPFGVHKKQAVKSVNDFPVRILAVELTSFVSARFNKYIKLKWTTSSEMNSDFFVLEKAVKENGIFQPYQAVITRESAGNSTTNVNYYYSDSTVESGKIYRYRLKIVDKDGSCAYSTELVVNIEEIKSELRVNYPNPFFGSVNIEFLLVESQNTILEVIEKSSGISYLKYESHSPAGNHTYLFQGVTNEINQIPRSYRPGIYSASLKLNDTTFFQNMILGFLFDVSNCEIPLEVTKTDSKGRFEIDYKWFPDLEEYFRVYDDGSIAGKFQYGESAKIVVRKTIAEDHTMTQYWVGQHSLNVDKSKVVEIKLNGIKYQIQK